MLANLADAHTPRNLTTLRLSTFARSGACSVLVTTTCISIDGVRWSISGFRIYTDSSKHSPLIHRVLLSVSSPNQYLRWSSSQDLFTPRGWCNPGTRRLLRPQGVNFAPAKLTPRNVTQPANQWSGYLSAVCWHILYRMLPAPMDLYS